METSKASPPVRKVRLPLTQTCIRVDRSTWLTRPLTSPLHCVWVQQQGPLTLEGLHQAATAPRSARIACVLLSALYSLTPLRAPSSALSTNACSGPCPCLNALPRPPSVFCFGNLITLSTEHYKLSVNNTSLDSSSP